MNISEALAEFVSSLRLARLPENIRDNINVRIVDYAASAAAGYKVNGKMNAIVLDVLRQQGGQGQSSALFGVGKLSASQAAYYNAFVCNGADMDDGHMLANGHPGVCVIPPVLALAEWRRIGYGEYAAAIAAGYEVFIRLAGAMAPSHLKRGFNGTGTSGTIAAAAACARALGLDAKSTHAAMGLAATSASGLMELNASGQAMKPINPAKSAYNGLMCALLAEKGAVGPSSPLDGKNGYIRAFSDECDMESITEGLGERFLMDSAYIKLYPACRHMHAMIDCAAKLREVEADLERVREIKLYTYPASEKLTGLIRFPSSGDEAKFSLTYAAATALKSGGFTLEDLDKAAGMSGETRSLIEKMEIIVCPELEDRQNMLRGAKMELVMSDGRTLQADVKVPKGEKSFPIENGDLLSKLSDCASEVLTQERQKRLYDAGMELGKSGSISEFYALTAPEA